MNFPEKVIFKLVDKITKNPVSNIAILLILYAYKKNNYSVGIKLSNRDGLIAFTKQDCLKEIRTSQQLYLMDYSSSLEECLPKVALKVMTDEQLKYVIDHRRESRDIYNKYVDCSEEFLKRLESVDNVKYASKEYPFNEEDLWQNKTLEIVVEKINEGSKS